MNEIISSASAEMVPINHQYNGEHRDLLRFLWWDNPELNRNPAEFHMTLDLFGATLSTGCANFALKTSADCEETCDGKAAEFLRKKFLCR